jgi:hypothetical protein
MYDTDIDRLFNDNYYLILLITTTIFVCLTLKFFSYNAHLAAQAAEEAANECRRDSEDAAASAARSNEVPDASHHHHEAAAAHNQVQIFELTSLTYEKLVSKQPRGFRTILLVVKDDDQELVNSFGRVCQGYCK